MAKTWWLTERIRIGATLAACVSYILPRDFL